ncbi:hypothetical protein ABT160_37225 [Streptomyces sp. NPDC001941]
MRELIDGGSLDVRDRIHTLTVYALALLLDTFTSTGPRPRVQKS